MRLRRRRSVPFDPAGGRVPGEAVWRSAPAPAPEQRLEAAELLSRVHEAIQLLPEGQRELVLLAYLDGLSTPEIAALLGRSPGAVRVGLHRARSQLRRHLRPLAPTDTRREPTMVEVTVEDVVVRVAQADAGEPALAAEHRIVVLRERGGDRVLPIWVGPPEGDALAYQLGSASTPRPLTADLMARLVDAAGARIERVAISSLLERTFYAVVTVARGNETQDVDARPSDALNLAVRVDAPVFVAAELLEEAAIAADDVFGGLERERERMGEPPLEGTWRSLSPELVRAVGSYRLR
jgi:uncharacterized protein